MNRGKCPVCFYKVRLRKDGTLQEHRPPWDPYLYMPDCAGSHQKPMKEE